MMECDYDCSKIPYITQNICSDKSPIHGQFDRDDYWPHNWLNLQGYIYLAAAAFSNLPSKAVNLKDALHKFLGLNSKVNSTAVNNGDCSSHAETCIAKNI